MPWTRSGPAPAPTLAPPARRRPPSRGTPCWRAAAGFTLLELLVVLAIAALATTGAALALRDSGAAQLEREGERLAALLESARAQSRASGQPVAWRAQGAGFRFEGLPGAGGAQAWLDAGTSARGPAVLWLGPEPLIGPQQVVLSSRSHPGRTVTVATDGLRPFAVRAQP
ncbi:prepilin-type N-terminal cleavage/methylation domain-containing protein [Melaminivora sp.]|uniref:prepilin-type N-terminal cleavage/methylation domain-containing protein n=1 Tax=Melaminivora sp. TaxID=1933032 RepID=UPI0028AE9E06|nr:prepilin-type N-terminal cleavage/methylation domain-containing protein [Melaminivora sp.]